MSRSSKKLQTIKPQQQQQQEDEEDILSNLPQPILHHILSFLDDIKYIIRTSILSKTWNSISTTAPFLDFNFETYGGISKRRQQYQYCWFTHFLQFVNKVLTQYPDSSTSIQRFHLQCGNEFMIPSSTVKKWIGIVIGKGVQDLNLEFLSEHVVLDLPCDFFSCRSLVNLKLMVLKYDGLPPVLPLFNLPESGASFANLRTLHLQLVCFSGGTRGEFMQKLFSSCPVLDTLVMRNCGVHETDSVVISANQIKYLEIDGFYAYVEQRRKDNCKITISAPNVESFICKGDVSNDIYIENLSSLVKGEIEMRMPFNGTEVYGKMFKTWKKKYDMMKFFGGLSNARALTLSSLSLEVIGEGIGILPTVFSGLRQLRLDAGLSRGCMRGIKHLLENSCNLDTLVMDMTWEPCSDNRRFSWYNEAEVDTTKIPDIWLSDSLLECNFSHLKYVEVWNTLGGANNLEFLRMLLKNAIALEKLTIFYTEGVPHCSEGQLMEFSARLLAFPRASSNVEILFSQV